jgi:succinate dehydrogenase/fumarate reductase flavoprotein subunit
MKKQDASAEPVNSTEEVSQPGLFRHGLSRRQFLTSAAGAGALAAVGALAGCAPAAPTTGNGGDTPVTTPPAAGDTGALNAAKASQKWEFEIPPAAIAEDQIAETITADIIIIGSGLSGLATAVSATEVGGDVILFSAGTKTVARGGSNHGIGTKVQERYGIDYTPDNCGPRIKNELAHHSYFAGTDKWAKWIANSAESMNWLIDMMEEAGYQTTLEIGFDDPEHIWDSKPASHNFVTPEMNFGAAFGANFMCQVYEQKINEQGGQIHYSTKAIYLERANNNTGRVTGAIAQREDGSYVRYVGNKAVVLATGDFSLDHEMMAKYAPIALPILAPPQEPNYDADFQFGGVMPGDGHKMGLWIGAAWQKTFPNAPMVDILGPAPYTQSIANHTGLILNKLGKRFMNEDTICSYSAWTFFHQPDMTIYFIWDSAYATFFPEWAGFGTTIAQDIGPKPTPNSETLASWDAQAEGGVFVKGDTIEDVLTQLGGIDVAAGKASVDRYNELVANGNDVDFRKHKSYLAPIKTGPFYGNVLTVNPGNFLCITGGLRTNVDMQVCDENDNPIEGLYNVGIMTGDMYGNIYNFSIPGHNLGACCCTFPYLLGRELAKA